MYLSYIHLSKIGTTDTSLGFLMTCFMLIKDIFKMTLTWIPDKGVRE